MLDFLRRRRARRHDAIRQQLIHELFERVNSAEPCPNPDCQDFRHQIRRLSCDSTSCTLH